MSTVAPRRALIRTFESLFKRRQTFRYASQLEQSQWWSRERLAELQLERLRSMVEYCFANTSFYRELWEAHGLKPQRLRSLEEFAAWPCIGREEIRAHRQSMLSDRYPRRLIEKSTGGSTGTPVHFFIDTESNERRTAAAHRGYSWAGAAPGTRQVHLWGVSLENPPWYARWKEQLYTRCLYGRRVLSCFDLSEESVPHFLEVYNRFRPAAIVAYAGALYVFARALEERRLAVHSPNSVIVGAEKLHGFQRSLIERVFGAPVFETYGSREFMLIGAECEYHQGLHLTMENLLVEIVDEHGRKPPAGVEGEVVVTDLHNRGTPFVRYRTGDRAIAGFVNCRCGRGLPLLRSVTGRQADIISTPDGRRLSGLFFPHLIKDYPAVRNFQVIQPHPDQIEVRLVVNDSWNATTRQQLYQQVCRSVGPMMRVSIREQESIPLSRAGKQRVVVAYRAAS